MKRGFTIIELLVVIVIGIMLFLASGLFRPTERLKTLELDRVTELVTSELIRARADAQSAYLETDWGLFFATTTFTRFAGTTYASRNPSYDTNYTVSSPITLGGLTEIVFQQPHATPTISGTITVTDGVRIHTIIISPTGVINIE
jgi:prepilin-type N-terminal cleavage/methylation domain-containing protein